MSNIKVIAFDADDTLWICEPIFRNAEKRVYNLLKPWIGEQEFFEIVLNDHVANIPLYGYGIKGYILSLTETALKLNGGNVPQNIISEIINIGKEMLNEPIQLLYDVQIILPELKSKYKLIVATKGDLLDQKRKLKASGLLPYFDSVEVMSDKKVEDYKEMFERLEINPDEFMMIGNSLRSDIIPVLELGGHGVHIPYEITWAHERVDDFNPENDRFFQITKMNEIYNILGSETV